METADIMILIAAAVIIYFSTNIGKLFNAGSVYNYSIEILVPNITLLLMIIAIVLMVVFRPSSS
jgi:hypothetical protein